MGKEWYNKNKSEERDKQVAKIYNNITELVGRTPIVRLKKLEEQYGLKGRLLAKLELFNPAGSSKDRVAKYIFEDLRQRGLLSRETVIIEPTSGNTGIAIAALSSSYGCRAIIVMPDTMSRERQLLIRAYGAELVLTDGACGMKGAIEKAEELNRSIPHSVIAGQFTNPQNPIAHRETTGPEILEDTEGDIDFFVAGVGTGGTLSGTAEFLKSKIPSVKAVAVEPKDSPLLSEGRVGAHKLQGIGANFVPATLNQSIIDEIISVSTEDAYACGLEIARKEGILVGISSGAALFAAIELAKRKECEGKTVLVLLPDTGERYLSSEMFL